MTNPIDPGASIRAGLDAPDAPGAERRARRIAASFRVNPDYDRLLRWRDDRDSRWGDVGTSMRIALGLYESQRDVAAAHGTDNTPTA